MTNTVREIADEALASMHAHGVPATPRNYELWFAFIGGDKPALTEKLGAMLASPQAMTPGMLDQLYREFLSTHQDIGAVRDGAGELQQIASELADRVAADRTCVMVLGDALHDFSAGARPDPLSPAIASSVGMLYGASAEAGERLGALQRLLAASIEHIADLKGRLSKAEQEATRDALTGLANRRLFDVELEHAADLANRGDKSFSLLLLDIDRFKNFNDKYGHVFGDYVLRLIGGVLKENIKGRDMAARYGGEEFAIVLPRTDLRDGHTVAEQIRQVLERRPIVNRTSKQELGHVTCSIGVARYRPGELTGDLIDRADKALYRAKRDGRNMVRLEQDAPWVLS